MSAPQNKNVEDYWMSLVRSALIDVLKHDASRHGYGAYPTRALEFLFDHRSEELDAALLKSEDEQVRDSWSEFVRLVSKNARITLLIVVQTILTSLPKKLIPYSQIPLVVNELQFA